MLAVRQTQKPTRRQTPDACTDRWAQVKKEKMSRKKSRDFTKKNVTTLAERAHFLCSNPSCKKMTTGPHSNIGKSLRSGEAAHIYGASDNGPRFNTQLKDEDIRNIKNGIWLCGDCHKIIDTDPKRYSVKNLQKWKSIHEEFVRILRSKPNYNSLLYLLEPTYDEVQKAKDLLDFLDNRRVFYNKSDDEIPSHVLRSIQEVRKELLRKKSQIPETFLADKIDKMLKGLRQFLDTLFDVDLNTLKCNSNDSDWIRFDTSINAMRKVFGVLILEISKHFQIPVGSDLEKIIPINQ